MDAEKAHMSEKVSAVSVNVESFDGGEDHEHTGHTEHTKRVLNARQVQVPIFVIIRAAIPDSTKYFNTSSSQLAVLLGRVFLWLLELHLSTGDPLVCFSAMHFGVQLYSV